MNCNKCEKVAKTWSEEWPIPNETKLITTNLITMDKSWRETIHQFNSIPKVLKHIEQLKKTEKEATKRIFIDSIISIWFNEINKTTVAFDIFMMRNVCMKKDQYWNENGELNQKKFHQLKCKPQKTMKYHCYHCKTYHFIPYDIDDTSIDFDTLLFFAKHYEVPVLQNKF